MIRSKLHEFLLEKVIGGMPYDFIDSRYNGGIDLKFDTKELCSHTGLKDYKEVEREYQNISSQFVLIPYITPGEFEQIYIYAGGWFNADTCEFAVNLNFMIMYQAGVQAVERRNANVRTLDGN